MRSHIGISWSLWSVDRDLREASVELCKETAGVASVDERRTKVVHLETLIQHYWIRIESKPYPGWF